MDSGGRVCCYCSRLGHFCESIESQDEDSVLTLHRYVAMHAMQEDSATHNHDQPISNGYSDGSSSQRRPPKPQMRDTIAAVGGMLIPIITQFGHHH